MTARIALGALAGLALFAAGCGGSVEPTADATDQPDDAKQLAYARCMRAEGIDLPDPGAGGRPGRPVRLRAQRGASPQAMERAMDSCRKKTGGGPPQLSQAEQTEFTEQLRKFAQCMRRNGVDMPDPRSDAGGIIIRRSASAARRLPDPQSPAFRRAARACREHEPDLPGRRGDGPRLEMGGRR